jgi:16S rRNA (cytidine1402-2'-O)-methyltransferase
MPSNSPTDDAIGLRSLGTLYVVATPIGNKEDITLRALKILESVDAIAAEDTRHTGKLLAHYKIKSKLISYHENNEIERIPFLIQELKQGTSVALVSNAGTPTLSDPGYRLIQEAIAWGIEVMPIPGANAAIAALSASGLPTDSFTFIGFLPRKKGKRHALLAKLSEEPRTIIFYESPKRILTLIKELIMILGDRYAVLSREMTKLHEEFIRGFLSKMPERLGKRNSVKGECTLLVEGRKEEKGNIGTTLRKELEKGLREPALKLSELVKEMAIKYRLPRNVVYAEALEIKQKIED